MYWKGKEILKYWVSINYHQVFNTPFNFPLISILGQYFTHLSSFTFQILKNPLLIIKKMYGFLLTALCFAIFIYWNNYTIVLGDHTNHQFSLHIPQLFYFMDFVLFFDFLSGRIDVIKYIKLLKSQFFGWVIIGSVCVHYFT